MVIESIWIKRNENDGNGANTYSLEVDFGVYTVSYPTTEIDFLVNEIVAMPIKIAIMGENGESAGVFSVANRNDTVPEQNQKPVVDVPVDSATEDNKQAMHDNKKPQPINDNCQSTEDPMIEHLVEE